MPFQELLTQCHPELQSLIRKALSNNDADVLSLSFSFAESLGADDTFSTLEQPYAQQHFDLLLECLLEEAALRGHVGSLLRLGFDARDWRVKFDLLGRADASGDVVSRAELRRLLRVHRRKLARYAR